MFKEDIIVGRFEMMANIDYVLSRRRKFSFERRG